MSNTKLRKGRHIYIYICEFKNGQVKKYENAPDLTEGLKAYIKYEHNRDVSIDETIFNNYFKNNKLPIALTPYIICVKKDRLTSRYAESLIKYEAELKEKLYNKKGGLLVKYKQSFIDKQKTHYIKELLTIELGRSC